MIIPISLVLIMWFSLIEGKPLKAGETCAGVRREDRSYDFDLPDAVAVNVQDPACDAEWTIDELFTAILDGNSADFSHPFKKVTHRGISAFYCPVSVRYHVSCLNYTGKLTCSCTNSTNNPVFSTTLPSRDMSSSALKTGSSVRQHYCAIAVAATVITLVILAFLICRTNSTAKYAPTTASADEQNQPASGELA